MKKPNVLWILAEDMCPNLGCYGDPDAITPNLDRLAAEGVRYTHVSSVGPVCSAARTTLALGMYPCTVGTGNHRSHVKLPEYVNIFSKYMQDVGYYTGINKTDYNFIESYDGDKILGWDTSIPGKIFADSAELPANLAKTWRQRGDDQPFFFMHTFACTHQSRYGFPSTPEAHRKMIIPRTTPEQYRDRKQLHIPAYHPDNSATREIWGQYHETITAMDRMVGETIDYLKADGIYEDTIIFFMGDNGMGIPSGKFAMWNEGTSVPLIVRVPEKYRHLVGNYTPGTVSDSGVCFVDMAPTALQIAGAQVPEYLQGRNFLAVEDQAPVDECYTFRNRIDSSCEIVRSVDTLNYRYIRNFYPHKGWRFSPYIATSSPYFNVEWEASVKETYKEGDSYDRKKAFFISRKPVEELYDLKADPDQMNNLAGDADYQSTLLEMRGKLEKWMISMNDGGLLPEQQLKQLTKEGFAYDVLRDKDVYPIEKVLAICNKMLDDTTPVEDFLKAVSDQCMMVRYWAVQGVYAKNEWTQEIRDVITGALKDSSEMVQLAAAETILYSNAVESDLVDAKNKLIEFLNNDTDVLLPLEAMDCMDRLNEKVIDLIPYTKRLVQKTGITQEADMERYIQAITGLANYFPEKMGIPHEYDDVDDRNASRLLELRRLYAERV